MFSPSMIVALAGLATAVAGQATIGKDEVTSRSVKDGSLLLSDFKKTQRTALVGSIGPMGGAGVAGTPAVGRIKVKTHTSLAQGEYFCVDFCPPTPPPGYMKYGTDTVTCDPGEIAIHGGASADPEVVDIGASYPSADGTGWTVSTSSQDNSRPQGVTAFVLCVRGRAMTFG